MALESVMLSDIRLSVIMPSVIMPSVIMKSVIMLSVIYTECRKNMLNAIMLNVVTLSVVAPLKLLGIYQDIYRIIKPQSSGALFCANTSFSLVTSSWSIWGDYVNGVMTLELFPKPNFLM